MGRWVGVPGRPIGSALVSKKKRNSMKQYWVYDSDSVPASRYLSVVRRWSCVTHYSFVRSLQVTCIRLQLGFLSSSPPTERDRVRWCAREVVRTRPMASRPVTFVAGVLAGAALTSLLTPVRHEVLPP